MSPSPGALNASIGVVRDDGTELREGYAEVGDVRLHDVEAGDGPLVVLLHGFPEFWYGWRLQIAPLAAAGFGSSRPTPAATTCLSSNPAGVAAYSADKLAETPRSHPRTRRTVRACARPRLGRNHCPDARDEPPRGRRPAGHPQRGASAAAQRRDCATRASCRGPGTSSTSNLLGCASARSAPGTGGSSSTSCATQAPRTRLRTSNATSRRGRSQGVASSSPRGCWCSRAAVHVHSPDPPGATRSLTNRRPAGHAGPAAKGPSS
jgi:hypothetical protein